MHPDAEFQVRALPLKPQAYIWVCHACGVANPPGVSVCGSCGFAAVASGRDIDRELGRRPSDAARVGAKEIALVLLLAPPILYLKYLWAVTELPLWASVSLGLAAAIFWLVEKFGGTGER